MLADNGNSAGDAHSHHGKFSIQLADFDRAPLPAIADFGRQLALAIGNDYGYEQVFEHFVQARQAGDGFIAISTSGRSPNVRHLRATAEQA